MEREGLNASKTFKFLSKYAIYIVLLILFLAMSIMSSGFLTAGNIINILRQNSFVGMAAIGMTFVVITGGIDLSVGAVMAFAGMAAAKYCVADGSLQLPLALAVLLGLAVAALAGLANGLLVTKRKVAPFIATLGMQTILRGAALLLNSGRPFIGLSSQFANLGQGYILGIPIPVVAFIVVIAAGVLLLHFLRFGRRVYAIGGNEAAARASGIMTDWIKIWVYVLASFFSGISGIILSARVQSASPISANGYELDAVAAVVIGGTSLAGGIGNVAGTIVGVLILGIITNGLDLLNVSAYLQQIIKGAIILIAALLDRKAAK